MAKIIENDPQIVAHVLDSDGNVYDKTFNLESAVTYANEGYKVIAVRKIGRYSKAQAQQVLDNELAMHNDCFGK